jgi:hypothetical protein
MKASSWVQPWPILHVTVPPAELPHELQDRIYPLRVFEVIVALNDCAGWTRTRISDWVEAFENRHPESSCEGEPSDQHELDEDEDDFAAVCVG